MNIPDGMAPFDLDAAKAGAPICMRNGSVVTFDSHRPSNPHPSRLRMKDETKRYFGYYETGEYYGAIERPEDLFMDKRTQEKKLQPFNLAGARSGDPICCRDGDPMKFVVYEPDAVGGQRVVAVSSLGIIRLFRDNGRLLHDSESSHDLFMAPKKIIIWTRHYKLKDGMVGSIVANKNSCWVRPSSSAWLGPAFKTEYEE